MKSHKVRIFSTEKVKTRFQYHLIHRLAGQSAVQKPRKKNVRYALAPKKPCMDPKPYTKESFNSL